MSRYLRFGIVGILGLLVGIAAGTLYAKQHVGVVFDRATAGIAFEDYFELTDMQYVYADEPHARTALTGFLEFVEKVQIGSSEPEMRKVEFLKAAAYIRLAVLEKHAGNLVASQSHIAAMERCFHASSSTQATPEEIHKLLESIEKRRHWGETSPTK